MRILQVRKSILINTDPQRRCYNGCHYSSERIWTNWGDLEVIRTGEDEEKRLKFWRDLSTYDSSKRREKVGSEYRIVEKEPYE